MPRIRCARCGLGRLCLCADLPVVVTRLDYLIVRHVREETKPTNTARLAVAAMPRCRILDYGAPGAPFDETPLPSDAWLLFPPERDAEGHETGRHRLVSGTEPERPGALIVLDGTWNQARRMSHRIRGLDALPRLALQTPAQGPARLRRSPTPHALATLDALALAVGLLEGPEAGTRLLGLHDEFVRRTRRERGLSD